MKKKFHARTFLFALILIAIVLSGCSGDRNPTMPPVDQEKIASTGSGAVRNHLWGYYDIRIDPDTLRADVVPVRGLMFNANIVNFLQPPMSPTHMLGVQIDPGLSDIPNHYLAVDVTIRHPFPGMGMYRGFDVRGIFMSDGSITSGFDPGLLYADWFNTSPGTPGTESVLTNADGYTRWWNPGEFTSIGTLFGYIQGGLAAPGYDAGATLNPFKYFDDDLDNDDPFEPNMEERSSFGINPGVNTRQYLIQFDGVPYEYSYAVCASWEEPDPSYAPDYPLDAFSISANTPEAFRIELTDTGSDAWYVDDAENGGDFLIDVEVFDWQAESSSTVQDEIGAIWVESDAFEGGYIDLLTITYEVLPGISDKSAVFRAEITPAFGAGNIENSGDYPVLIAVESSNPSTYEPQLDGGTAFDYPDAMLAAYDVGIIHVLDEDPNPQPDVILVMETPQEFAANASGYDTLSPAIVVEHDGDLAFAYAEWNGGGDSYAAVYRSHDDGSTWPDWRWNQHFMSGSLHAGDTIKIWPSSHNLSYQIANLANADESVYNAGHASGTFPDGPNGSEKANNFNNSIDNASEILQDSENYVYFLGDAGGQITFKRSVTPECLNCPPGTFGWSGYPTYPLVNPGRLSRVRSSALYDGTMYLVYFEPDNDIIRLAYNVGDGFTWDTSTIVWDADGSGAHSPRDPGLHIDESGFHGTFVRTDFLTGFNELCYTYSSNGSVWSEPVVIRSNVFELKDSPIWHYDWVGQSVLCTVWEENENIWTSFSLDDGDTWVEPIMVSTTYDQNRHCDLVVSGTDNWHFVYSVYNTSTGRWDIDYRRAHLEWE